MKCAMCGGTGAVILDNSWFRADGTRRQRCGICKGSGTSSYRPDPDAVRVQAEKRAALTAIDTAPLPPEQRTSALPHPTEPR